MLSVLVPAAAATLWLIDQTYDAERRAHERSLSDTARALSMVVDRELSQRATVARVLALSRNLDAAPDLTPEQLAQFEEQARRAMQGLDGWVELASAERVLLDTRRAAAARPAPDTPADAGMAALVDLPTLAPLQASAPGAEPVAAVVQPVQRGGRTRLNLRVTIRAPELQRIIDAQHLPAEWHGFVLDSRARVVAGRPGDLRAPGGTVTPELRERLATQAEGFFESVSPAGLTTTGYYSTSPQGWTYVIALPREQYAGRLPSAVLQVAAAALLLLALAGAAAYAVARGIARPVVSLKHMAERMQSGLPVARESTGIAECDEVVDALAQASQSLIEARRELEHQVEQAVLRTQQAERRTANSQHVEALGRLTGGVAHDFNNLLGVISNSAHLMQRHALAAELQAPLAATLRAVSVGSRLTQSLLRVAGRQNVQPQCLDLGRHLPELQELLHTVLGRRIALSISVAAPTQPVTVDADEFELALINLALNARDAMPAGGQAWVRAFDTPAEDSAGLPGAPYVTVSFTDEGTGIEGAAAARAFEPFFTTKEVGKGTGLGLAQVQGFCVQAGGVARLSSTPGLGTTVSLLLPAAQTPLLQGPPAAPEPASAPAGLQGRRLLLVDDNDELAAVTASLLEAHGAQVRRARGPDAALALVQAEADFDAVLSDIVMPGDMDGVALARALRGLRPGLPVLLITGYSAEAARAQDFVVLHKPCPERTLLRALHAAMAAGAAPGTLQQGPGATTAKPR